MPNFSGVASFITSALAEDKNCVNDVLASIIQIRLHTQTDIATRYYFTQRSKYTTAIIMVHFSVIDATTCDGGGAAACSFGANAPIIKSKVFTVVHLSFEDEDKLVHHNNNDEGGAVLSKTNSSMARNK